MPRNVNTIPGAWFRDPNIICFEFVRMSFPSPTGVLYWTNWSGLGDELVLNLDGGGDQTWDTSKVWIPGQFEQSDQSALAVSDVSIGNADYAFSDILRLQTYGCRGVPITVWLGAFDKATEAFIDRVMLFQGEMDRAEVQPDFVRVSLLATRTPLTAKFPRRRYSLSFGFNWIPKANLKIQFGDQQLTLPTPTRPPTAPATAGGGGGVPPPNVGDPNARGPVILSPRNRPAPRNRGGRSGGGRDPRTVTR